MKAWDLYDDNLNNTHEKVYGSEDIPNGYYHLAFELWIINSKNELLLIKNSIDYSRRYPGSWMCVGGSLESGETYEEAIERIIDKKIGMKISTENKVVLDPVKRDPYKYAYITCVIHSDVDLNKVKFNDDNSIDIKFVNKKELEKMCENGEFAYYLISRLDQVNKYWN